MNNIDTNPEIEHFAEVLDLLLEDKKIPKQPHEAPLRTAVDIKASLSGAHLRDSLDRDTEALLMSRLVKNKTVEKASFNWRRVFLPVLGSSIAAAALFVFALNPFGTPELEVQTLADIQGFESLSQAEVLLGELAVDSITEDGILLADVRSSIHEMNVLISETDVTLDPEQDVFPHVQLRDAALELVKLESDFLRTVKPTRVAKISLDSDLNELSRKASSWPSQNEGVDFETHEKAVTSFVSHSQDWQDDILEITELLIDEII